MRDPYLYPDSEVLINLAGIHDEQRLRDMESDFVSWRLSEVASGADLKEYNFETLCKLHQHIFKDNAAYMRSALVAASAVFHDLGDRRRPEYLYRIIEDALEQGQEMKREVIDQIQKAGIEVNTDNIRQIVSWNRRTHTVHTGKEIKDFLDDTIETDGKGRCSYAITDS